MGWGDFFFDWALDLGLVDGQLYSLSDELETLMLLYYNTDVFEANGWTPPDTMDELNALGPKKWPRPVTPSSRMATRAGDPSNEWFVGEYMTQIASPQNVYKALTGQIPWTDESMVEAMEVLDAHMQAGWYGGGIDLYFTNDGADPPGDVRRWHGSHEHRRQLGYPRAWANTHGESGQGLGLGARAQPRLAPITSPSAWAIPARSTPTARIRKAAAQFLTWYFSPATQGKMLTDPAARVRRR